MGVYMTKPTDQTTRVTTNLRNVWGLSILALLVIVAIAFAIIANRDQGNTQGVSPEPSLTMPNEGVSPTTELNTDTNKDNTEKSDSSHPNE
jgi:hypothetical protein